MKKMSSALPASPSKVVPFPDPFNLIHLLTAAATHGSLALVADLWNYILQTGVNPCWCRECFKAITRLLSVMCYPVYSQLSPYPCAGAPLSRIA